MCVHDGVLHEMEFHDRRGEGVGGVVDHGHGYGLHVCGFEGGTQVDRVM